MDYKSQVLSFIEKFVTHSNANSEGRNEIEKTFASGYCYYFAVILKEAFNRGEICWVKDIGHIVWKDIDGIAYDIYGEFDDYDELIPVSELYSGLLDFKHNGIETPEAKRTAKVHKYYKDNGIQIKYDEIKKIAKENAAKVFVEYDIITYDPFQIVYYTLLSEGKIEKEED